MISGDSFALKRKNQRGNARSFDLTVPHSTSVGMFVNRNFESLRKTLFASFQLIVQHSSIVLVFNVGSAYLVRSPTEHSTKMPFDGNDERTVSSTDFSDATQSGHLNSCDQRRKSSTTNRKSLFYRPTMASTSFCPTKEDKDASTFSKLRDEFFQLGVIIRIESLCIGIRMGSHPTRTRTRTLTLTLKIRSISISTSSIPIRWTMFISCASETIDASFFDSENERSLSHSARSQLSHLIALFFNFDCFVLLSSVFFSIKPTMVSWQ